MTSELRNQDGPIESGPLPERLVARVITPGRQPRLHGYAVEADLAVNYGIVEVAFLALTGELPDDGVTLALNAVLVTCGPMSIASAPTHAATLSQLCGAEPASTLAVAAIALAEQARYTLEQNEALLEWLQDPRRAFPGQFIADASEDLESLEYLRRALAPSGLCVPGLDRTPTPEAARLLVLHACGLRTPQQLQAILTWARLPLVVAEAFAENAANFRNYPINLPRFDYTEQKS